MSFTLLNPSTYLSLHTACPPPHLCHTLLFFSPHLLASAYLPLRPTSTSTPFILTVLSTPLAFHLLTISIISHFPSFVTQPSTTKFTFHFPASNTHLSALRNVRTRKRPAKSWREWSVNTPQQLPMLLSSGAVPRWQWLRYGQIPLARR